MKEEPITIRTQILVTRNPIGIRNGTKLDVVIDVFDEYYTVFTSDDRFTKDLVRAAKPNEKAKYSEDMKKTIVKYPSSKTKEKVAEELRKELEAFTK